MKTLKRNCSNHTETYGPEGLQVNNNFGNVLFADSNKTQRKGDIS